MLAVISHDAGGAEIVASYVAREGLAPLFVLEGPARAIFARHLGQVETIALDSALDVCDWVLCGTGWQSDLEVSAIRRARALGKRSVAFLDHWVRYRERFRRGGAEFLPDEIWVGDELAGAIARDTLPELSVRVVGNPFLESIARDVAQLGERRRGSGQRVLYVGEPIRAHSRAEHGHERAWGYTEEEALRYFLRHVGLVVPEVLEISIRPHPSEEAEKYSWVGAEFDLPFDLSGGRTLAEDLWRADVVVGCESMALVVALSLGKSVISSIPAGGRPCALPHPGIQRLETIIDARTRAATLRGVQ